MDQGPRSSALVKGPDLPIELRGLSQAALRNQGGEDQEGRLPSQTPPFPTTMIRENKKSQVKKNDNEEELRSQSYTETKLLFC